MIYNWRPYIHTCLSHFGPLLLIKVCAERGEKLHDDTLHWCMVHRLHFEVQSHSSKIQQQNNTARFQQLLKSFPLTSC